MATLPNPSLVPPSQTLLLCSSLQTIHLLINLFSSLPLCFLLKLSQPLLHLPFSACNHTLNHHHFSISQTINNNQTYNPKFKIISLFSIVPAKQSRICSHLIVHLTIDHSCTNPAPPSLEAAAGFVLHHRPPSSISTPSPARNFKRAGVAPCHTRAAPLLPLPASPTVQPSRALLSHLSA
jgi:hypothetical protein